MGYKGRSLQRLYETYKRTMSAWQYGNKVWQYGNNNNDDDSATLEYNYLQTK